MVFSEQLMEARRHIATIAYYNELKAFTTLNEHNICVVYIRHKLRNTSPHNIYYYDYFNVFIGFCSCITCYVCRIG